MDNEGFRESISAATHTLANFETRFRLFQGIVNQSFGSNIDDMPIVLR
jgi:hypothetical protein